MKVEISFLNKVRAIPINPNIVKTALLGSNFNELFKMVQFHFHWGYNEYQGGEHLIDSQKYPLEVYYLRI